MLKLHEPDVDLFRLLDERMAQQVTEILANREEILTAFVAKYGFEPDDAIQIVEQGPQGFSWRVERRHPPTIREAYDDLCRHLGRPRWISSVGLKPDGIVIYLRTEQHPELPTSWWGFPVESKFFGEFAPLGTVPE
jgi:hypothetical protein